MAKPSSSTCPVSQEPQTLSSSSSSDATSTTKSEERSPPYASDVLRFLKDVGISDPNVENYTSKDFYSNLLCNNIKTDTVRRGHVTCFATVKPPIVVILLIIFSFYQNYNELFSYFLGGLFSRIILVGYMEGQLQLGVSISRLKPS